MANNGCSEWFPTSLCEKPRRSSPKESAPDLILFIFVLDVILVLYFSTNIFLIG